MRVPRSNQRSKIQNLLFLILAFATMPRLSRRTRGNEEITLVATYLPDWLTAAGVISNKLGTRPGTGSFAVSWSNSDDAAYRFTVSCFASMLTPYAQSRQSRGDGDARILLQSALDQTRSVRPTASLHRVHRTVCLHQQVRDDRRQ